MTDFLSASCVAIAETCIGHPLDTMKILIQNNISYKKLPLKHFYKGWRFPFANSLLFNCTVFPMYERTLPYTNSHIFSGFLSGVRYYGAHYNKKGNSLKELYFSIMN